ncbi:MAG: TonB-dependent receptor [Alphaproteobacteria bacterium]|nr:TonB-dependent receptor [Alphaproteobacteria bacterium]
MPGLRANLDVSAFHSVLEDAIDLAEGAPPQLVNRSGVRARGVEGELSLQVLAELHVVGHLAYVETEIRDSAERLRNRPKWRGGGKLQWQASPDLTASVSLLTVGQVFDSAIPTGDLVLAAHTTVNLAVTYRLAENLRLLAAIENLLDEDYEEAIGTPSPGLVLRTGASMRF